MRPYCTFQPGDGARCPASISASASSSARRREVSGARTWAGSSPSRRKGSPAQASARRAAAARPSVASDAVVGCSLISCMDAARTGAALVTKGDPAHPLGGRRSRSISVFRLAAQAPKNGKGILGPDLVDKLAARLDPAVDAPRQLDCLLPVLRAGDHVGERPRDVEALGPQLLGEVVGLPEAMAFDPHLPRRVAAFQQLLLGVRLRRIVVPALLVAQPTLGHEPRRREARLLQLRLDQAARLLRLHPARRVDEHRVAVARDGEPMLAQLVRELFRVVPRQAEPVEQAAGALLVGQLDANAPVVLRHQAGAPALISANVCPKRRSDMPIWSRCFVIPPRKNGQPAPRSRPVSTSAASGTTLSSSRRWVSSATASSTSSTICSPDRGAWSTTTGSPPSASDARAGESGNRSGKASCMRSRTWFATRGPTICKRTEGAIGIPSDITASSTSSTGVPCSIASMITRVMRVRMRLTTNPGASRTRIGRFRSCSPTVHTVASASPLVSSV